MGGCEGYTELDRSQRNTTLKYRAFLIKIPDLSDSFEKAGCARKFVDNLMNDVVFHFLQVLRGIPLIDAVKILAPDFKWILPEVSGNVVDNDFDADLYILSILLILSDFCFLFREAANTFLSASVGG